MKRSEILLSIVDVLNNSPKSVVNSYVADCILTRLEDLGMLPPFNSTIEESKVGYGAAYLDDETVRERYCNRFCKWEPENV